MEFVFLTGMSGAGKSNAANAMEDLGFYCIDNIPPMLITSFVDLAKKGELNLQKIAIVTDIRSGEALEEMEGILSYFSASKREVEILYMDASDEVLIKRFKETRRLHPLFLEGRVEEGIKEERRRLGFLKSKANYIIETDNLLVRDLHAEIEKIFVENKEYNF